MALMRPINAGSARLSYEQTRLEKPRSDTSNFTLHVASRLSPNGHLLNRVSASSHDPKIDTSASLAIVLEGAEEQKTLP